MLKTVFGTLGRALAYTVLGIVLIVGIIASIAFPPLGLSLYFELTGGWSLLVLLGWIIFLTSLSFAILENYSVE